MLKRALDQLRPAYITVDVSNYAVAFRQCRGGELAARLAAFRRADGTLPASLEAVEAQIAVPFEAQTVAEWCSAYELVGDNDDSRSRLEMFEKELMSPENLAYLSTESFPSLPVQVGRQWEKARVSWRQLRAGAPCDERIAGIIRRLLMQPGESLCHITGWEHVAPLAELLADHSPTLRLLDEFA